MTSKCLFSDEWDCSLSKENTSGNWTISIEKYCALCIKARKVEAIQNTPKNIQRGLNSMSRAEDEIRAKLGTLNNYLTRLDNALKRLDQDELEVCAERNWDKRIQIEKVIEVLNKPNLENDGAINQIISVLDLEMTASNGWQKRAND